MVIQAAAAGSRDDRYRSFGDSTRLRRSCEFAGRMLTIAMTLVCRQGLAGAEERPVATMVIGSGQPLVVAVLSLEEVTPPSCHSSQVDVELWMHTAPLNTMGFNAFVEFNEALLSFASGMSTR